MLSAYFKIRARFNFSPHRFEIGNPLIQSVYIENHFFKKLLSLREMEYSSFYYFHLKYFLSSQPGGEADFFAYVFEITQDRIRYYKRQDPFSARHSSNQINLKKLKSFQQFLTSIDSWKKQEPLESILEEKEQQIGTLKEEIDRLQTQLQKQRPFEPSEKIAIADRHLGTFINLVQQMQQLVLPDGRRLLRFQSQSSWYKLISKYFEHGNAPIPVETARNYFPAKKDASLIKGSQIPSSLKVFKILPSDPGQAGS